MVHTIKKHGPDRIAGFSPIPAMSMISYAAGARLMQLIGGISLSFYDWYCDLPPASPETWGEQTDVAESADWYHAKMLVSMGANIGMTRTPDCHFLAEGRHNGTKLWVFSPDFSMVAKYADEWVAVNTGQDGAWWMAVNHVLLTEFHHQKQTSRTSWTTAGSTPTLPISSRSSRERTALPVRASCCGPADWRSMPAKSTASGSS